MTPKRFRVTISNTNEVSFVDVVENKQLMSITFKNKSDAIDCKNALMYQCDLLNKLHEQVQAQATVIKGYQDRNEILNQQIYDKNKILLTEIEIGEKLHDENNRIKQTIQDMMETERTELGKSVLKQLYEAIQ